MELVPSPVLRAEGRGNSSTTKSGDRPVARRRNRAASVKNRPSRKRYYGEDGIKAAKRKVR